MEHIDMEIQLATFRDQQALRREMIETLMADTDLYARAHRLALEALVHEGFERDEGMAILVMSGWDLSRGAI